MDKRNVLNHPRYGADYIPAFQQAEQALDTRTQSCLSAPSGVVTLYATGARKSQAFQLVAGTSTTPGHESHGCMDIPQALNPAIRTSTATTGFIGLTDGWVARPPGEWQICFRETDVGSATNPVFYTVL